jgi:hypothetical protein
MSLEEDIVTQRMSQGSDQEDMTAFVKALESTGLKINRKKVDVAVERYGLIQKYKSMNKKENKRIIEKRFKEICKSKIEQALMKSASIISAKVKVNDITGCKNCEKIMIGYFVKYKQINELEGIYSIVKGYMNHFNYCHHCGNSLT